MFIGDKDRFMGNLEMLFNRVAQRSEFYKVNINSFNEKIINIYIIDFGLDLNFRFDGQKITLFTDINVEPDVKIQGEITDFIKTASYGLAKKPIPAGLLKIKGDVSLIQNIQKLLIESEVIFEEILSSYLGGPFAESIVGKTKNLINEVNILTESVLENSKVFLKEDTEMFVTQEELVELDEKIMNLSNCVDSLENKFQSVLSAKG
ncbi:SCP2 sterol-binding domain-containing protein [Pseudomonadota bacterium]|nr:SCP2 sterol-binding domain-containing protein [Pseudomonadota bacterium]